MNSEYQNSPPSRPSIIMTGPHLARQFTNSSTMGLQEGLMSASKIVNEYDQEIPQSQTADIPVAP